MPKPNKQFRYQEHCIFCAQTPLTDEEVYAEWIREHLSSTDLKTMHQRTIHDGTKVVESTLRSKPGSPYVQKLKIVCAACNNGWMSAIQGKTRPTLLPLIQGKPSNLTEEEKIQIATWATMFTIVFEYRDKSTMAITQQERDIFMATKKPLNGWHIFASDYHSDIDFVGQNQRGFDLAKAGKYDTQITSFTLGKIMITCFSSTFSDFINPYAIQATGILAELGFTRIWPLGIYQKVYPKELNENGFTNIANMIQDRWEAKEDNNLYALTNTY